MDGSNLTTLIKAQRAFFESGATRAYSFRIEQLKKIKWLLEKHEDDIVSALQQDLHKPKTETLLTEILMVTKEIDFICKHLHKWMRPLKVGTPLRLWPAKSRILSEPYGLVLIISPWNYPIQLTFSPLIGALSAGNCVLVKPSEIATHSEKLLGELIPRYFPKEYIAIATGGHELTRNLLDQQWDYIFYTGGTETGKMVMNAAAHHLTPLTLELGGKSPCIVDESADLAFAAKRIAWAKTINAGQVCIAPDYLLVHANCKQALLQKLQEAFVQFYGQNPIQSPYYARIVNHKHFTRLTKLLAQGQIIYGGHQDEQQLYLSPTLIDGLSWQDSIMQEEIFGPILPIFTFDELKTAIEKVQSLSKPLALYFFSKKENNIKHVLQHIPFGGAAINDCLLQAVNPGLPFGGIGYSGLGQYHGKYSYDTFSHYKSIFRKLVSIDFKLEYPPYTATKLRLIRTLFKL